MSQLFLKPLLEITAPDIKINQHLGCVKSLNSQWGQQLLYTKISFLRSRNGVSEALWGRAEKGTTTDDSWCVVIKMGDLCRIEMRQMNEMKYYEY